MERSVAQAGPPSGPVRVVGAVETPHIDGDGSVQRAVRQGQQVAAAKEAGAKVQQMLDTGESRAAVAARLGLSTAEMKRALDGASASSPAEESRTEPALASRADDVAEQVAAEAKAA
jgi:ParB-like chromosome segregation protein Spo0J